MGDGSPCQCLLALLWARLAFKLNRENRYILSHSMHSSFEPFVLRKCRPSCYWAAPQTISLASKNRIQRASPPCCQMLHGPSGCSDSKHRRKNTTARCGNDLRWRTSSPWTMPSRQKERWSALPKVRREGIRRITGQAWVEAAPFQVTNLVTRQSAVSTRWYDTGYINKNSSCSKAMGCANVRMVVTHAGQACCRRSLRAFYDFSIQCNRYSKVDKVQ
jgi:hypothetical protein